MAVTDFLTYIGYPYPEDHFREDNPVNLFGVPAFCAEANIFIQHVFLQLVMNSDWPRRQKELWIQRYMLGKSIDSLARYLRRTPAWAEENTAYVRKGWPRWSGYGGRHVFRTIRKNACRKCSIRIS